jgi:hypothetical protein
MNPFALRAEARAVVRVMGNPYDCSSINLRGTGSCSFAIKQESDSLPSLADSLLLSGSCNIFSTDPSFGTRRMYVG